MDCFTVARSIMEALSGVDYPRQDWKKWRGKNEEDTFTMVRADYATASKAMVAMILAHPSYTKVDEPVVPGDIVSLAGVVFSADRQYSCEVAYDHAYGYIDSGSNLWTWIGGHMSLVINKPPITGVFRVRS